MRKRIVVAVVLAVILAASAYAQTSDFFQLVRTGTPQSIQAAIDQGADVNGRSLHSGETPLMWAARDNTNTEVITALLKDGADINGRDEAGNTALMWAAWSNTNSEVITVLLKAGADAKVKNSAGKTALDYAQDNWRLKGTDAYRQLREASQ